MPASSLERRARWIVVAATAGAIVAALRYPGGTPLDATTSGYSLSRNFLSDLGMTVAYNHEANRLGAACFVASLLLFVIGLGSVVARIVRFLAADARSRTWARLAALALFAACVGFAGGAVTPENRLMNLHVAFSRWAWRIVPLVALFLALASRRDRACARRRHSRGSSRPCRSPLTRRFGAGGRASPIQSGCWCRSSGRRSPRQPS